MAVCVDEKSITVFNEEKEVPETSRVMKLTDRCDACSAAAHNVAVGEGDKVLMFCNHHLNKHLTGLLDSGFTIEKHEYSV